MTVVEMTENVSAVRLRWIVSVWLSSCEHRAPYHRRRSCFLVVECFALVSVLVASTVASTKSSAAEARRAKMAKSKQRTEQAKTAPKEKSHKESKTKNKEEFKATHNKSPRKSPRLVQVDMTQESKNKNNSNRNMFRRVSDPEDPVLDAALKTPSKTKQCNKPDTFTTPSSSSIPKMRSLVVCLTPLTPRERQISGGGTGKRNTNAKGSKTPATGRRRSSITPQTPSSNGKMKQPTLAQFMTMRPTPNAKQRLIAGECDAEPIVLCKEINTDDIKMEVDDEESHNNLMTFKSETNDNGGEDAPLDLRKQMTTSTTTTTPLRPSALDTVVSRLGSPACNTVDSVTRSTSSPNSQASLVNWQSVRTKITPTKGSSPCRGTLFGPVKKENVSPGKLAPVPPVETLRREITPNNSPTASPKPIDVLRREATPNSDSDSSVGSSVRSGSSGVRKGRVRTNRGLEPSHSELQRVAKQGVRLLKANQNRTARNENLEPAESPTPKTNESKSLKDKLQTTINGILATRNTDAAAAAASHVKEEESMDVEPQGSNDDYDKVNRVKKYDMREGMQFMW